ncbi:MAG: sterol desaturase family protein [Thiotrichales bacterium]|nr:MAG: sterol desaturase family protein [Thiotrichales bacterium]
MSQTLQTVIVFGAALFSVLLISSLVEYVVHRLMHARIVLGKKHLEHHVEDTGQGWWGEFLDYFLPSVPFIWLGFLHSIPAGIGWVLGVFVYACIAAYAHQVQHDNPDLVFWLDKPVHHLHHKGRMWHHNFGITFSFWDRIFGTYKDIDWKPEKQRGKYRLADYFQIQWY